MIQTKKNGCQKFQSTHPARGATERLNHDSAHTRISIHAPRERCDARCGRFYKMANYFNPRTPREVRQPRRKGMRGNQDFNPRTPREVRLDGPCKCFNYHNFNPRTPREVRPGRGNVVWIYNNISIHAPRERCDENSPRSSVSPRKFQSTHPARGATLCPDCHRAYDQFQSTHPARGATRRLTTRPPRLPISIHAPRERCDKQKNNRICTLSNFNPRTPREVRHTGTDKRRRDYQFQSTHPARGATADGQTANAYEHYFNPRTPREVRRLRRGELLALRWISIHAPRERCDCGTFIFANWIITFQSTHPARGATAIKSVRSRG